ncbi:MAG: glyoxalase [Polaribacter sp.]|jgi:hypothetical protein|nr:glyoxalase [Polaribacter sp.]MDG1954506.1 glyoxalase [Polaribacter sp.]MDG2073045.1 glyoxalase [Polaribacter sp.]
MDNKKVSIRPVLNLSSISTDEDFQNRTLRPVLKLQNNTILQVFSHFSQKQKTDINNLKKVELNNYVNLITKNNTVLRNQLLGLVIGQFTKDEFDVYKVNDLEFNKRIINMIGQRILDNH